MSAEVQEVKPFTAAEARELTDRIRKTLRVGHDLIVTAFKGRAWAALGYDSWDAYCAGEFAEARMVRLDREQRREIVAEMRGAGMSTRAIASGLGVNHSTVIRDGAAGPQVNASAPPAPVTGLDGKTYTRPAPPHEGVVDGVVVDTNTGEIAPQRAPQRRALPDQFFDAAFDLTKAVERVARLVEDDRFTKNKGQIAAKHRVELARALDGLSAVVDRLNQEQS